MSTTTRIVSAAGAFVVAGVAAKALNHRQAERRRRRRGEDVVFGSVHSTTQQVVATDGVRLNVEIDEPDSEHAGGPTLVFTHGIVSSLDVWHYQRLALRGRHRMVFMDHRSHGRSDRSSRDSSTIGQLGADLKSVLDACAGGPVVLVGHSMGGMTVMSLAADHPELFGSPVVGAVLVSTSSGRLLTGAPLLRRLVPVARVMAPAIDWGKEFNSYSLVSRALGPEAQERHVDMTNEMVLSQPTHILTDFHPMLTTLDLRQAFDTLAGVRTVIVCGTHDLLTPLVHSRRLAAGIDGSTLVVLDRAGHMLMFEEHDRVTGVIDDLADEVA